jgi:hypothetical protein
MVVVRGVAEQADGVGLYGDVDLSAPPLLRLTLYDSVPGRPVSGPPPPLPADRQRVRFEARIGPVPAGAYQVSVGRYDARSRLVVVEEPSQQVQVEASPAPRPNVRQPNNY